MTSFLQRRPGGQRPQAAALLLAALMIWPLSADLAIVTGETTPIDTLEEEQAQGLWLASIERVAGIRLNVADRSDSEIRSEFYHRVLFKTRGQVKAIRAKRAFQHGLAPPPEFPSDETVLAWVRKRPNRLGYVDAGALAEGKGDGVKVLLIITVSTEGRQP